MYKVLIADDEEFVRNLVIKNLRTMGLDIEVLTPASNAQETIELAHNYQPDILITDIEMPGMNGLEVIRTLQEENLPFKSVIISGYDQFDYAKKALSLGVSEYLLKPFTPKDILKVLQQIITELDAQKALQHNLNLLEKQANLGETILRQEKLRKILLEEKIKETEQELGKILGIDTNIKNFVTGLLVLEKGENANLTSEQIEDFTLLVKEKYFSDTMQVVATKIHDRQLAFLFGGREKDEKIFLQLVHQGIGKILASMKQYYNITLSASIGKTCNRLTDISQSWQSAITVWKGMYNGEKSILFYPAIIGETDTVLHTQIHHEIKENKNLLRYAICDAREKEAYIIFEKLMKCYTMLPFQKTNYIIASLEEFLFDLGEDIEHLGFKSIVEKINEAKKMMERESLFDIKQMMEKYIHIYCDMIKNFSLTQRTDLQAVKQALRYIDDHLQDSQLSAELVAKQLMFSTSYFRQIFRKMTNESFNEYLIQKRMARAAVLLKNNQMIKIQNLAEMCGYENQRYFASSFKKYYGCTPTEYKEECLENLSAEVGHVI